MILAFAVFIVFLRVVYCAGEIAFERDWPRNTIRGLGTAIMLLCLCAGAFGQLASRVDTPLQTAGPVIQVPGSSPLPQVVWLSNASVQICVHPASIQSCTPAPTYNDSNEDAACPANAPLVQLPGVTCTASTGVQANVGFWFGGGTVDYIVTSSYGTFGPFSVTQLTGAGSFVKTTPSGNVQQTVSGPLSKPYDQVTAPVPFAPTSAAFFGYNQNGNGEADLYSGNGGGFDLLTPNQPGTGWTTILHVDSTGTITPANDVQLTSGNGYMLGGSATEGVSDDQFGGVNISTTSSATNGITFQRGGVQQWQMAAAGSFLNSSGQTVLPSTVTTFQGASAGGPFLITGTTGTGSTGVLAASPSLTGTPTVPTATFGTSTTQAASTAFVQAAVVGSTTGVASIDTQTGAFTFSGGGVSHVGNAYTFSSASGVTSVAQGTGVVVTGTGSGPFTGAVTVSSPHTPILCDVTIPITTVVAGDCFPLRSNSTPSQITSCTGFTSTAGILMEAQSSYVNTVGWSPVLSPIVPIQYADASPNTIDYRLCNNTSSPITTSAFGARMIIFP